MKIENLSFVGIKQVLSRKDLKQIMAGCAGAGGGGTGGGNTGGCANAGTSCGFLVPDIACCDGVCEDVGGDNYICMVF